MIETLLIIGILLVYALFLLYVAKSWGGVDLWSKSKKTKVDQSPFKPSYQAIIEMEMDIYGVTYFDYRGGVR